MTRRPATNGRAPRPRPTASSRAATDAELAKLLRRSALHARALLDQAGEYAKLALKRLQLRAVDGLFDVILKLCALAGALTILVSAARLVVAGLQHAIAQLAGVEWVGELGGGALAFALPFLLLLAVRRRTRRSLLAQAMRRRDRPPAADAGPTP